MARHPVRVPGVPTMPGASVTAVIAALLVLTCYRVTRLLTTDSFPPLLRFRHWVAYRWGSASWQAYLSECPWCVSVWIAAMLVAVLVATVGCPYPLLVVPALSATTGILDTLLDGAPVDDDEVL